MRVLICGSRSWDDAETMRQALAELPDDAQVLSGGARGADRLGEQLARQRGLAVRVFPADWEAHGKRAGVLRNLQMLDQQPDQVWAFWDGASPGTAHTLREARRRQLPVRVWQSGGQPALPGLD